MAVLVLFLFTTAITKFGAVGMKMRDIAAESVPLFKAAHRVPQSLKIFAVLLARQAACQWLADPDVRPFGSRPVLSAGALSPLLNQPETRLTNGALGEAIR